MEEINKERLLECIGAIATAARESELKEELLQKVEGELTVVSDYFRVTRSQALLVAVVFTMSFTERTVEYRDLMRYFNCSLTQILKLHDDLSALLANGIIKKEYLRIRGGNLDNTTFIFNAEVAEAIFRNQPYAGTCANVFKDELDLLKRIYQLGQQREEEEISTDDLLMRTGEIVENNVRFPSIAWVQDQLFPRSDTYFFLYLVWKTLTGQESVDVSTASAGIFDDTATQIRFTQQILFGESPLLKCGLIDIEPARFHNDTEVKLADKTIGLLKDLGLKLHDPKANRSLLMLPESIISKKMIYNDTEQRQLRVIRNLIQEKNLTRAQTAMARRGFPTGITVLFHGLSGTGKTETVLQLARQTGREIKQVDISRSKSMWFGESERIIRRIFDVYRELLKESDKIPILLFNEADAIISRRRDAGSSAVVQTENAMQNILLEELERFSGILFATTNLVSNIDEAFDRRFLFKVEFYPPDTTSRRQIWKVKLPELSVVQYRNLAALYEFSGAQIDNVVRRCEMETMLNGEKITFETIVRHCDMETLSRKSQPIGFIKKQ
jgi:ATP-dependent 26S proteasome regulatory subunit